MPKLFFIYCLTLVASLALANYQGYVYTSLFTSQAHADRASNHYHK